jgi:hypothetical protein
MATRGMSETGVRVLRRHLIGLRRDSRKRVGIWKSSTGMRYYYEGRDAAYRSALSAIRRYMRAFPAESESKGGQ